MEQEISDISRDRYDQRINLTYLHALSYDRAFHHRNTWKCVQLRPQ